MKVIRISLAIGAASLIFPLWISTASVAAVAPASSIAGSWSGPMLGKNWTFEFSQNGENLTGRFKIDNASKWTDVQSITYVDGLVQLSVESLPPSSFQFKIDSAGKAMTGSVRFGEQGPFPLTLTRNP
jgi:hypothetical protein